MPTILLLAFVLAVVIFVFIIIVVPASKREKEREEQVDLFARLEEKLEQVERAQNEQEKRLANLEHIVMDERFSEQDWAPKQPIALKQEIDQLRQVLDELKKR
ncbi:hypothetical protein SapgrDRAFT_1468 [Saprospira grandis DSM 2844]|uniref:Phage shock protein B n=1 Tax=Saprospira grandis DSM 2844 TaxID=694433 RepID=J0P091_9BACT|nr:hypothetical protein [Saprospira grandis]EJF53184.1 hypothetical protein SapgrDRAFT_1468 [Saprospira grandis DSM 2844]